MVFHGLGPLGCIPSQRVKSTRGICLKQVNLWVQEFNSKVGKLVSTLNKHLPNAQISFADTYPIVLDLIENPTTYGKLKLLIKGEKTPASKQPLFVFHLLVFLFSMSNY